LQPTAAAEQDGTATSDDEFLSFDAEPAAAPAGDGGAASGKELQQQPRKKRRQAEREDKQQQQQGDDAAAGVGADTITISSDSGEGDAAAGAGRKRRRQQQEQQQQQQQQQQAQEQEQGDDDGDDIIDLLSGSDNDQSGVSAVRRQQHCWGQALCCRQPRGGWVDSCVTPCSPTQQDDDDDDEAAAAADTDDDDSFIALLGGADGDADDAYDGSLAELQAQRRAGYKPPWLNVSCCCCWCPRSGLAQVARHTNRTSL
jgi:hypothetical protein